MSRLALADSRPVQVNPGHYRAEHYDEFHRWVSYWYQIQSVARTQSQKLLEIGLGSGVLSSYLRTRLGLEVTTFDFDASLRFRHCECRVR